ncbi:putative BOI-related E3 ubiquitin-protein ligase 3 [Silene latifolia]|uniref:putative BOI-related E3 ubiquitin-protein ligase 3 n=1 Tax=Silene latifolia TaxID=37657 RepID=UPI003D775AAD
MAIQAHFNPNNNLPQDYFFMSNNNNNYNNNLLYNKLLQQQQQQFQYAQQQQQFQYVNDGRFMFSQPSKRQKFHETTTTTATSSMTSDCDNNMSTLLEKQRNEIDRFVNLQNERLRLALQEQRKQQFGEIIKKLEVKTLQLLKQKDDEIKDASKKTMELQEMMKKIEVENQTWQRIALENQSMVISLNNSLEQLKQQQEQEAACSSSSSNNVDDNASCCNNFGAKTEENRVVSEQQHYPSVSTAPANYETRRNEGSLCKVCNSRNSTILLLPCRHFCCCKVCDGFVDDCPVCKSSKMASIEALIS